MRFIMVGHVVVRIMHFSHKAKELLRLNLTALKQVMLVHQKGRNNIQVIMVACLHEFKYVEIKLVYFLQ